MKKEQMLAALVPVYNAARDEYDQLFERSLQLLDEHDDRAYRAVSRKVGKKFGFVQGVVATAEALGITEAELLIAAIQDKYTRSDDKAD